MFTYNFSSNFHPFLISPHPISHDFRWAGFDFSCSSFPVAKITFPISVSWLFLLAATTKREMPTDRWMWTLFWTVCGENWIKLFYFSLRFVLIEKLFCCFFAGQKRRWTRGALERRDWGTTWTGGVSEILGLCGQQIFMVDVLGVACGGIFVAGRISFKDFY